MTNDPSSTPIVLCADDFGLSPGISEGILELVDAGRLSAVSCLTTSPCFLDYAEKLKLHSERIEIGLHLVLTDLKPLGSLPSLTTDGALPQMRELFAKALLGHLAKHDIAVELGRQIDAFIGVIGRAPDFIDGHHHIHQLPGIRDIVLDLIEKRFKSSLPWMRVCSEKPFTLLRRGVSIGRGVAIGWFGAALRRRATQRGLRVNNGFSGVYDFSDRVPYSQLFERFTLDLRAGSLIMCHPGRVDEILRNLDSLTDQRERELAYFLSDAFPDLLRRKALHLGWL